MCRQEIAGSCRGCPIIDVVAAVARIDDIPLKELVERAAPMCPTEFKPQESVVVYELNQQRSNTLHNSSCEIEAKNVQ
jgi:hypothetical protein